MPNETKRNQKRAAPKNKKPAIRKKDVRAKKEAKRQIKKKFGREIEHMNADDLRCLKEITKHGIKKERLREKEKKLFGDISRVRIRTPLSSGSYSYTFDVYSMMLFIQALTDYYSTRTNLFSKTNGVTPAAFRIYCVTAVLTYLQRVGKVIGTCQPKIPQPANTTFIPQPLFKWMEYIAPFVKNGISQSMEFIYNDDWSVLYDFTGAGDGMLYGPYQTDPSSNPQFDYTGFMNTLTFTQTSIATPNPPNANVPAGQTCFVKTQLDSPVNFSDWMVNVGNLSTVSNALKANNIPSLPITDLPGLKPGTTAYAPDGSAYCVKAGDSIPANNSTDMPPSYSCLLNIHEDFDCNMWYLLGLFRLNTTVPSTTARDLKTPIYNFNRFYGNKKPMPWYCQAYYTFIFLCDNCDKFSKGKTKYLTLNKARLKHFFPNVRIVTSFDFVGMIWEAYRTLQLSQTEATVKYSLNPSTGAATGQTGGQANETKSMTNWTLFLTVAFLALQRRFNEQQIVPCNSPLQFHDAQMDAIMPQLMWVDQAAAEVNLPKNIAKAIDNLGVVIKNGRLLIPGTTFTLEGTSQTYPYPASQLVAGVAWSAVGFTKDVLNTYKLPALLCVNVGTVPSAQAVPAGIKLDNLSVDLTYAQTYSGYNTGISTLYPIMLSGTYIQKYHELYLSFILGGNSVNTIEKCLSKPRMPRMGSITSMTSEVVVDTSAPQVDSVLPQSLQISGPSSQVLSQLVIVRMPVVTISAASLLTPSRSMEAIFNGWCMVFNQGSSQPVASMKYAHALAYALLNQSASPVIQQPVASGAYNATTIAGNSLNAALSKLTANILKPDSEFAKEKEKLDAKLVGIGSVVPTKYAQSLQHVSDNPAFDAELQKLERAVFGDAAWRTTITSSMMGKVGKRMPPGVAQNFAAIDTHSDTTSDDNAPAPALNSTPKVMEMKCDGHRLKNFGNFCKSALKTTGDIAKTACDTIDSVGRATAAIGNIVP